MKSIRLSLLCAGLLLSTSSVADLTAEQEKAAAAGLPSVSIMQAVSATSVYTPSNAGANCPSGAETGALDESSPVFNRPVGFGGSCSLSAVGTNVAFEVFSYNLQGPPPHDLLASTIGGTTIDTVLIAYRAADGSHNPFDPGNACANSIGYNDDSGGTLQSALALSGLEQGYIDIVLTTFGNDSFGNYSMDVSSTSCQDEVPRPPATPIPVNHPLALLLLLSLLGIVGWVTLRRG